MNCAEKYLPFNELYQTADHPALISAILNSGSKWRVNSVDLGSPGGKPSENPRHLTWRVGGGCLGEVWFGSFSSTVSWHPPLHIRFPPLAGYLGCHPTIAKPKSCRMLMSPSRRNSRFSVELLYWQTLQAPLWSAKQWFKTKHI